MIYYWEVIHFWATIGEGYLLGPLNPFAEFYDNTGSSEKVYRVIVVSPFATYNLFTDLLNRLPKGYIGRSAFF